MEISDYMYYFDYEGNIQEEHFEKTGNTHNHARMLVNAGVRVVYSYFNLPALGGIPPGWRWYIGVPRQDAFKNPDVAWQMVTDNEIPKPIRALQLLKDTS